MRFDILTIFPKFFDSPLNQSLLGKAIARGIIEVHVHDIRAFASDKHRTVDDSPYGGGSGMVMKAAPVVSAVEYVKAVLNPDAKVVYVTPQGKQLNQSLVSGLASLNGLIIICGRYEGIDQRAIDIVADMEISIGDYVLNGGETPALVIVEAVARLVPDVLGSDDSAKDDTFSNSLLEYPHYTRPESFKGCSVPDVLLSGNHEEIRKWRRLESIKRTWEKRPDILDKAVLTGQEREFLEMLKQGKR